jgi:hypothetical protein
VISFWDQQFFELFLSEERKREKLDGFAASISRSVAHLGGGMLKFHRRHLFEKQSLDETNLGRK